MSSPLPSSQSFVSRYLTLFGGEAVSKLCVMVAFAYLARVLGPSIFGTIELVFSVTIFFVLGVESGMASYAARRVAAAPHELPALVPSVMTLRLLLGVPAYAIVLTLAWAFGLAGLGLLAITGLSVLFTPFYLQWVFQGLRHMQWVALGTALRNVVFVVCVVVLVRRGADVSRVAWAEIIACATMAIVNVTILARRVRIGLEWTGAIARARALFGDVWYLGLGDLAWATLWYGPGVVVGWMAMSNTEHVAWIATSVRIVVALHTFVFLYFFNLLPNLATALASSVDDWRDLVDRSVAVAMWPAGLMAVGSTLAAPVLVPLVYGHEYDAAIRPLQISVWLIPILWFSGHHRFSLIAAGQQRWDFAASVAAAVVVVPTTWLLARTFGASGAATAMVVAGLANALVATRAASAHIGALHLVSKVGPVAVATVTALSAGLAVGAWSNAVVASAVGVTVYGAFAWRHIGELASLAARLLGRAG